MEGRKLIALYGGTFDPVHVGHLSVARNLLRLFALDEVLFIPAHVAPHKRHAPVSPPLHRYAMLALATQDEPRFSVSTVELDAPERPYTVETLAMLSKLHAPASRLFFVMGADSWVEIGTWREWERVLGMVDHIVVTRPGFELTTAHLTEGVSERIVDVRGRGAAQVARTLEENRAETKIYLSDAALVGVSATEVRRAAQQAESGAELAALVPPAVADYINKYRLYRETNETGFTDAAR
jgi:nicotinate-nucleotide adenylyltransferase